LEEIRPDVDLVGIAVNDVHGVYEILGHTSEEIMKRYQQITDCGEMMLPVLVEKRMFLRRQVGSRLDYSNNEGLASHSDRTSAGC
jgi:hypothetical protein